MDKITVKVEVSEPAGVKLQDWAIKTNILLYLIFVLLREPENNVRVLHPRKQQ